VLGGGGRYDHLTHRAAGEAVPACGFGLYVDRIASRLADGTPDRGPVVQVQPVEPSPAAIGLALAVAEELQNAGFCAELAGSRRSPECRWSLEVDLSDASHRYRLRDLQNDSRMAAASMDAVIVALGRGRC
jgi:histidyl-tRNA synthetase